MLPFIVPFTQCAKNQCHTKETCPLNTCKNVTFCCQLCRGVLCLVSCKMKCHDIFPHIIWTYLDLSGHIWTKVDNGSGNCRTFASSIRNDMQTGQDLLLGGGEIAARRSSRKQTPTPFRAGVKAKPKTKNKTRPKPGNGRA